MKNVGDMIIDYSILGRFVVLWKFFVILKVYLCGKNDFIRTRDMIWK